MSKLIEVPCTEFLVFTTVTQEVQPFFLPCSSRVWHGPPSTDGSGEVRHDHETVCK